MLRTLHDALDRWASDTRRKPLVLRGARQVGKSWLLRTWGAERFDNVVEVNLERRPEVAASFGPNDPRAVLSRLGILLGRPIAPDGSTLLFLDEIQALPEVLAKLRWFAEELPLLPVVAAGSLLDFTLAEHRFSMPVGRITYLHLEPMGFHEFCQALGEQRLVTWLSQEVTFERVASGAALDLGLHEHAQALFRSWLVVGGMPAAVEAFRQRRALDSISEIHRDLLATLRDDFAKYADRVHHERLRMVLDAVPGQLGRKWKWSAVSREQRAPALRRALDLLVRARIAHRITWTPARGVPLGAGSDPGTFKAIHLDVGLASTALGLDLSTLEDARDVVLVNEGAIAEQAVGQLLRLIAPPNQEPALWYWAREGRSDSAELDYVLGVGSSVVPVEVKAGAGGTLKSLHAFMAERKLPLAIRFNSAAPLVQDIDVRTTAGKSSRYRLLSLPMYLAEEVRRLASTGLEMRKHRGRRAD